MFPRSTAANLSSEPDGVLLDMYLPEFAATPSRHMSAGHRASEDRVTVSLDVGASILTSLYAHMAADRDTTEPYRDEFGLRTFRVKPRNRFEAGSKVYFAESGGVVRILISCTLGKPFPLCEHRFNAGDLSFQLRYAEPHQPQWKLIESGVLAKLQTFRKVPP
jgi:hypothetical protein